MVICCGFASHRWPQVAGGGKAQMEGTVCSVGEYYMLPYLFLEAAAGLLAAA